MQQYSDTIQDRQGNVIGAATVTVTNYPSGTTATTYATNAIGSNTNPITADNNGQYSFYAVDGSYTVTTSKSGITTSSKVITLSDTTNGVSVKGYGAVGDGTTDDTAAIQAAVTNNRYVTIPAGTYKLTSAITVPANTRIQGAGINVTVLKGATNNAGIFTVATNYVTLSSMLLDYSVTPVSGANAIALSGSYFTYSDIFINACYNGLYITGGQDSEGSGLHVWNYVNTGYYGFGSSNDHRLNSFFFVANSASNGALGGIRLENGTQAFSFSNGEVIQGAYGLTTTASSYVIGSRPAYHRFSNVYFDSAINACEIDNIVETSFQGCWFSNGRSGGGAPGATIGTNNSDGLRFTDCDFFNCGTHGALVRANAKRTIFKGCSFESNSFTAGAGVANGLVFAANTTDFVVQSCVARNGLYTGTQGYGIIVNGGTSDRYIIADNLVTGNVTAGVSDGGSGVNKRVANNY